MSTRRLKVGLDIRVAVVARGAKLNSDIFQHHAKHASSSLLGLHVADSSKPISHLFDTALDSQRSFRSQTLLVIASTVFASLSF